MRSSLLIFGIVVQLLPVGPPCVLAAEPKGTSGATPKEVSDLAGLFTGSWTIFGIDEKGEVIKRMAWTDTMKAENPEVKGDRAYVATTDEMTFEGGKIPPFEVQGKEGYFLNKDGSLGDYFIEISGQTNRVLRLGNNAWTYATPAAAQELVRIGFPEEASGNHVLVKVVTREQGVETHRISRLTTVSWKDANGNERWLQYVSLQGFHQRRP